MAQDIMTQLNHQPAELLQSLSQDLARRARTFDTKDVEQLQLLIQLSTSTAVYAMKAKQFLASPLLRRGYRPDASNWRSCGLLLYSIWQNMTPAEVEAKMKELGAASSLKFKQSFPNGTNDVDEQLLLKLYSETPPLLGNGLHGLSDTSLALRCYVSEMLATVAKTGGAFDFGGADGVCCALLKMFGAPDVTLIEPSHAGRTFAHWYFNELGMPEINIHEAAPGTTQTPVQYSAGICTEVLEHVVDPPALIRRLHQMLLPGGVLFVTSSFAVPQDTHLQSNLKYAGKEKQLMYDAGFALWNPPKPAPVPLLPQWGFWKKAG